MGVTVSRRRARLYGAMAAAVAFWLGAWVFLDWKLGATVSPSAYYLLNYDFGFTRRGLAGAFATLLSRASFASDEDLTERAAHAAWFVAAVYIASLLFLVLTLLSGKQKSERRIMLALIVLLLPGWFARGVTSGAPEVLGCAALILYSAFLAKRRSSRGAVAASTAYGACLAVLAFAHEGVVLIYGLGTLLAIAVFLRQEAACARRACAGLALLPGIAATLVLAVLARSGQGLVAQLCSSIPNRVVTMSGVSHPMEYRAVAYATLLYGLSFTPDDSLRFVGDQGAFWLVLDTVIGALVIVLTIRCVGGVSGTPFAKFVGRAFGDWSSVLLVVAGAAMFLPLFALGVDWIRWWVCITMDVGIVYILYCAAQPEIDSDIGRRTRRAFPFVFIALLLFFQLPPQVNDHYSNAYEYFNTMLENAPDSCRV